MEPFSTILGALLGDLFKDGVKALASDKIKQWRTRFAQLKPGDKQAVQRAVLTAYWQAVLHVFAARARELNLGIEALLIREGVFDAFAGGFQLAQYALDASLPSPMISNTGWQRVFEPLKRLLNPASAAGQLRLPPAPDEREWLPRAILKVLSHLATIRTTEATLPELPADDELERLLARPFTHDDARELELRAALLNRVIADIEKLCGDLPGEALIAALQSDWHKCFRVALHAALAPGQAATHTHLNQQVAEILCRLQDNPAVTPDALRAALALNNQALIQHLDDITERLQQRDYADEAQIWLAPLFATAQNLEQAFAALPAFIQQDGAQTRGEMHGRFDELEAKLGNTPDAPSVPRAVEENYLHWLQNELQETVYYTKLSGSIEKRRDKPAINSLFRHWKHDQESSFATYESEDALQGMGNLRRVILLGDPGSGKTVTLAKLAADLAAEALQNASKPLPLFIRLGGWVEANQALPDYIAEYLSAPGQEVPPDCDLSLYVAALLAQGRAALLLDGLNEFPPDQRPVKYAAVRAFITEHARHHASLLAVVSCRELDYQEVDLKYDRLLILPLDPLRIREFVTRYLGEEQGEALFWKLADGKTREFYDDFIAKVGAPYKASFWRDEQLPDGKRWNWHDWEGDDDQFSRWPEWLGHRAKPSSLMKLASNPYLLSMLTELFEERGVLPDNRGDLFRLFVNRLMKREKISADDQRQLLAGLTKVARTMQMRADDEGNATTILSRAETVATLGLPLGDELKDQAGNRLLRLAQSASLLSLTDPVRFTHQLLQEFFAALWLDTKFRTGQLPAANLWKPDRWWQRNNWEEAAILLAGLYNDDCSDVIHWLADAQPELAAQCLNRSGARVSDATLEKLRDKWLPRLTDMQSDPEPQARAAIGRALGRLNLDDRKGVALTPEGLPDIDWVEIPDEGEFIYGAEKQADDPEWFTPAKPQTIPALPTFWMSRYPVTNAQFQAFVDHLAQHNDADRWFEGMAASEDERRIEEPRFNFSNHPRERVNWYQAMAFCRWLSWRKNSGFDLKRVDTWDVRLPTEAEWERAARGTTGLIYSYGNEFKKEQANVYDTGIGQTSAVGIFPDGKSPEGVLDMSGNVWEWCLSEYKKPEVKPQLDARKEKLTTDKRRVLRGGAWDDDQGSARAVCRNNGRPGGRSDSIGFRVVLFRPPSGLL